MDEKERRPAPRRLPRVGGTYFTSIRTDKVSGKLTCTFGIVMCCFASANLMMAAAQRAVIALNPQDQDRGFVLDAIQALHRVWFIYLPIMIIGGLVFGISGFYIRRGSQQARRIAQATAIVGYIWGLGYSISLQQFFGILFSQQSDPPNPAATAIGWFAVAVCILFCSAFPTGLLYILSRPQKQSARSLPTE